eukprot:SAG22_NODE_1967_length_3237_cov_1.563416_3_plen_133_part_00
MQYPREIAREGESLATNFMHSEFARLYGVIRPRWVFVFAGVDIVFSSYIHVYQRSKPLRFAPTDAAQVRTEALPFCCAPAVFLSKTVPFRVVPLDQGPTRDYGHERSGTITTDNAVDGGASRRIVQLATAGH